MADASLPAETPPPPPTEPAISAPHPSNMDQKECPPSLSSSQQGENHNDRRRSRSPRRDHDDRDRAWDRPRRKDAGFKWKEKRHNTEDRDGGGGLQRGYRDHYRPRSRSPRRDRDRDEKPTPNSTSSTSTPRSNPANPPKEKKKPKAAVPTEQPIRVFVNDRLGTKKEIPCYPSDSVKDFKAIVAMMIGRRPHEILLKRQGERPFKDVLTLQDYGVSNNVQLDLEVDTGD